MAKLSWFQRLYWRHLSKPATDRALYHHLLAQKVGSILEFGIGSGERIRNTMTLIQIPAGVAQVKYIGVDLFESASDGNRHLSLKEAHKMLGELGVKGQLIPGDLSSAMHRVSNSAGIVDLIIVDGGLDPVAVSDSVLNAWWHKIAGEKTVVFGCAKPGQALQRISISSVSSTLKMAA